MRVTPSYRGRSQLFLPAMMYCFMSSSRLVRSFVVHPAMARSRVMAPTPRLWASTLPDIATMRAGEIKKELESYGISTKSFLEKSELVGALEKAREEGLQPKASTASSTTSNTASDSSSSSSTTASDSSTSATSDSRPHAERLQEEIEKCNAMKASELKKELEERGVSTKSFFEKSEFVQALAEARVDGVQKKASRSSSGSSSSGEEGYAEYKNVEVLTDDSAGPRKRSAQEASSGQAGQSSPFGGAGGASPFGGGNPFGAGGMPGGMGGMGGIADMLKNMGMGGMGGGGGAGSPFGGAGAGSPFGGAVGEEAMCKAQQMMQNPKVREIMAKAQSNPRIMKIMTECMSNPMAVGKYENDPEVSELIKELKKFM